jgi:hypothetical protein
MSTYCAATAAQNAAYRAGLCVGMCGRRYSAGRPRCNECHAEYASQTTEQETARA